MVSCKTAVTPLLMYWSYCSLALLSLYIIKWFLEGSIAQSVFPDQGSSRSIWNWSSSGEQLPPRVRQEDLPSPEGRQGRKCNIHFPECSHQMCRSPTENYVFRRGNILKGKFRAMHQKVLALVAKMLYIFQSALQNGLVHWWLANTVGCHYNRVQYTVLCRYYAVNFLQNIHRRHPIARPWGRGMGCLL